MSNTLIDFTNEEERRDYFYDIILDTSDDIPLYYHRMLLIKSPYFKALLTGQFKEGIESKKRNIMKIVVKHPSNIMNIVLNIIFDIKDINIKLINKNNVKSLIKIADEFQLDQLKSACLKNSLTFDVGILTYKLIKKYNPSESKSILFKVMNECFYNENGWRPRRFSDDELSNLDLDDILLEIYLGDNSNSFPSIHLGVTRSVCIYKSLIDSLRWLSLCDINTESDIDAQYEASIKIINSITFSNISELNIRFIHENLEEDSNVIWKNLNGKFVRDLWKKL